MDNTIQNNRSSHNSPKNRNTIQPSSGSLKYLWLKGQSQGHNAIFKGLKIIFRTKIWEKNYTMLISIKNTTNFVLTTFLYNHFFDRALDRGQVEF